MTCKFLALVCSLFMGASVVIAQEPPWSAADDYYGEESMDEARENLQSSHGNTDLLFLQTDRFEYLTHEGEPLLLWDFQGWYGSDLNKFWVKSEGEFLFDDGTFEEAEVQALYSRAVTPFFDIQAGLRHDFKPNPSQTYAVIGFQGLAPYWFEIDSALFISDDGDVSARLEAEYELLLTQRLIVQPRAELDFAFQDVPVIGIASGFTSIETGIRMRYEIRRQFAPYIGLSWNRKLGGTADIARLAGEDPGALSFALGIRSWF